MDDLPLPFPMMNESAPSTLKSLARKSVGDVPQIPSPNSMSQSTDENAAAEIRRARARERQQRKRARDRAKRVKSGQSGDEGPKNEAELQAEEKRKLRMRENARLRQQKHRKNLKARRVDGLYLPVELFQNEGGAIVKDPLIFYKVGMF